MAQVFTDDEVCSRITRMLLILMGAALLTFCNQKQSFEPPLISVTGDIAPLIAYAYVIGFGVRGLRSMPIVAKGAVIALILVASVLVGIIFREILLFGLFRWRGYWVGV